MATVEQPADSKGPSLVMQLGVLALLSGLSIGAGWLSGSMMSGQIVLPEASAKGPELLETRTSEAGDIALVHLEPITTTLAAPADMWVRLELSLIFAEKVDSSMAEAVHQDLFAYMRTVKSHQIEGASGFQHFRADLAERADIRSAGAVRDVLIRTLILE